MKTTIAATAMTVSIGGGTNRLVAKLAVERALRCSDAASFRNASRSALR